jgi:hypothetical protein
MVPNLGEKTMPLIKGVCAAAIALLMLAPPVSAEQGYIRQGFWGGIDAGVGLVGPSFDGEDDEDDNSFYLGLEGGYAINPHFLVGVELGGWLLAASDLNDPDEGRGISQAFLITRLYPGKQSDFFLKAGGGHVSIWSNSSGDTRRKQGLGLTLGGGYDFRLNEAAALTPFVTFSYGDTGSWNYQAITFGLGVTLP